MTTATPSLTPKTARDLTKKIVKDSRDVRVVQGKTNGRIVLHLVAPGNGGDEPGDGIGSVTIKSAGEWENHPLNLRVFKPVKDEEPQEATDDNA